MHGDPTIGICRVPGNPANFGIAKRHQKDPSGASAKRPNLLPTRRLADLLAGVARLDAWHVGPDTEEVVAMTSLNERSEPSREEDLTFDELARRQGV
jgi:hypothetical protein